MMDNKAVCPFTMQACPGPSKCFPGTQLVRQDLPSDQAVCPIVLVCDCFAALATITDEILSKTGAGENPAPPKGRDEFIEQVVRPDQEV